MNNLDAVVEMYRLMKLVSHKGQVEEYTFKEKILPCESCQGKIISGAERVATSRSLVCGGIVDRINR
jgi:hypothetical protein